MYLRACLILMVVGVSVFFPLAVLAQRVVELPSTVRGAPALRGFYWESAVPAPELGVVMVHGCGGIGEKNKPSARFTDWATLFRDAGLMVVLVDSFHSRSIKELCTQKFSERSLRQADRIADVQAGAAWLRAKGVKRVLLAGWSHGGGVVLDTLQRTAVQDFVAALAFYPGCTSHAARGKKFKASIPLVIHIGEADDWTPAASCVMLGENSRQQGLDVSVHTYPGAYHSFDNPNGHVRLRSDVPNGVRPGEGVHVGPDPVARALARERVTAWLERLTSTR